MLTFLLEDTPEKEKQTFTSSFSCQLGLVIPKQTPWNLHGQQMVLHLPGIIVNVGMAVP